MGLSINCIVSCLIPSSSCPHVEVSLSRTLNSKLPCMVPSPLVCECVYEWVNVRQIISALSVKV